MDWLWPKKVHWRLLEATIVVVMFVVNVVVLVLILLLIILYIQGVPKKGGLANVAVFALLCI